MQHPLSIQHISLATLPAFIREHNRSNLPHHGTLHIWHPSSIRKSQRKTSLRTGSNFVLRFTLPNILHAAIRIAPSPTMDAPLRIMTVAFVGFNEVVSVQGRAHRVKRSSMVYTSLPQKPYHAASDYTVFRMVSQHVARAISERPAISLPLLIVSSFLFRVTFYRTQPFHFQRTS